MSDNPEAPVPYIPTTTHATWGAGHPRLLVSSEYDRHVHELRVDVTRIGSSADVEIILAAADPVHATVTHDADDEYVLTMHGSGSTSTWTRGPDGGERPEVLRTGAQFTAGPWRLVFARDEYADHGRPYGGRQGGEFAHQKRQPPRPDYARLRTADEERIDPVALGRSVLADAAADASSAPADHDSPLSFDLVDDQETGVYAAVSGGREIGGVTYNLVGDDRIVLLAVSVLPEFRGRGVASELVHRVLDQARLRGRTVTNYCPVVRTFIQRHPEYADLIDAEHPGSV